MTIQINSNYLENYANNFARIVCDQFFQGTNYLSGEDLLRLTPSTQVNYLIIKRLFELWKLELLKLKNSPYFDYRDVAVHEALTAFMNVLSRRIKVDRVHLEPLLRHAVHSAVQLATDPLGYYFQEIEQAPDKQINEYLLEHKKYYKWHASLISVLIDKTGIGQEQQAYSKAIREQWETLKDRLDDPAELLEGLNDILPFALDSYLNSPEDGLPEETSDHPIEDPSESDRKPVAEDSELTSGSGSQQTFPREEVGNLDAAEIRKQVSAESYPGMSRVEEALETVLAINDRYMFRSELFGGEDDALISALRNLDACESFDAAIDLLNSQYPHVSASSTPEAAKVEFFRLIYRKFMD